MDYDKFKREYKSFEDWWREHRKFEDREELEKSNVIKFSALEGHTHTMMTGLTSISSNDDRVNSPSHYTSGRVEVIEVIEDAVKDAPSVNTWQGCASSASNQIHYAYVVKRQSVEDAKKAEWYLKRLIDSLNS